MRTPEEWHAIWVRESLRDEYNKEDFIERVQRDAQPQWVKNSDKSPDVGDVFVRSPSGLYWMLLPPEPEKEENT